MWGPLILALVQWLGPILFEAFKAWLERRLRDKAKTMPARVVRFGVTDASNDRADQVILLNAVRDDLWFWQVGKKRAIDQCIKAVKTGVRPVDVIDLIGKDAV